MKRRYLIPVVVGMFAPLWGVVILTRELAPAREPAQAAPAGPAPHIAFDTVTVNLGDVVHGQDAVATFAYKNSGDAPLHILSAKPG
jgi:redox-sensitive bicupin YhaK (pirin superfamily)